MSALVVDLGNSRCKMAVASAGRIGDVRVANHGDSKAIETMLAGMDERVDEIWIASVVDDVTQQGVIGHLRDSFDASIHQVRSDDAVPGVVTGYRKAGQLGVDRLLAMVAARARTPEPFCVIDAGTAATVDFVDQAGQHLGGFILPGLQMARDCLLSRTSIPRDAEIDETSVLGRDTPSAVAHGARYAIAGLVEHFMTGRNRLFGEAHTQVFVGGGDAEVLFELLPSPCTRLDHLVLRGLAVVAATGGE